jgi:membrane-bound ClpP family serine protease
MVPILFQGVAMLSCLLIYAGANLFMLDAYGPLYGASASVAMMFSRYFVSFLFPLFSLRMFKQLGVGWATSLLAVLMLLMAPIPWAFWIYGERIRKRSRYETRT